MNRKHALTISLAAALAAIAGVFAATKSVHLGHSAAASATATSPVIASRTAALDRTEAALRKALAQKPPRLPPSRPRCRHARRPPSSLSSGSSTCDRRHASSRSTGRRGARG